MGDFFPLLSGYMRPFFMAIIILQIPILIAIVFIFFLLKTRFYEIRNIMSSLADSVHGPVSCKFNGHEFKCNLSPVDDEDRTQVITAPQWSDNPASSSDENGY